MFKLILITIAFIVALIFHYILNYPAIILLTIPVSAIIGIIIADLINKILKYK